MLSYVSPESTEELVARHRAGEEPPTAEVIEELELFSHEREKAVADGYVTSTIVSSEAGDRYLVVRGGFTPPGTLRRRSSLLLQTGGESSSGSPLMSSYTLQ